MLGRNRPTHRQEAESVEASPLPSASEACEIVSVPTLDLGELDLQALRGLALELEAEIRRTRDELAPASEAEGRAAFEALDADRVRAAFREQGRLTARQDTLTVQLERVRNVMLERSRPVIETWTREAEDSIRRWKAQDEALVDRIERTLAELSDELVALGQLPSQRQARTNELQASLATVQEQTRPYSPSMVPPAWSEPPLRAIAEQLVGMARNLGMQVNARWPGATA
jgi:hypothetical protein